MFTWTHCVLKWALSFQLVLLIARQALDFMGAMWLPILVNFVSIIMTIMGLFSYLIIYIAFQLLLIAYNVIVICFYFNVGHLNRDNSTLLNLGTGSRSYWYIHSSQYLTYYGSQCIINFDEVAVAKQDDESNAANCAILPYFVIESVQAALHILIAVLSMTFSIMHLKHKKKLSQQDDSYRQNISSPSPSLPPYSIASNVYGTNPSTSASLRRSTRTRSSTHSLSSQRRSSVRKSKKRRRSAAHLQHVQQSPITKLLYNYGDADSILSSENPYGPGLANPLYYGSRSSITQSQHLYDTTSLNLPLPPPPPPSPPPPPPPPHHSNSHRFNANYNHHYNTNQLFNIHSFYQQFNNNNSETAI